MSKHTALPWEADEREGVIVGPRGNIVLTINDCDEDGVNEESCGGSWRGNMGLIVQACNNYEALKGLIDRLAALECLYGNGADCNMLPQGVVRSPCFPCQAREALKKAGE